jgi:mono/diheme cytochrome c family protein
MRVTRTNAERENRWRAVLWLAPVVMVVAAVACSRNNMDYGPAFASAETRGSVVYEKNCSQCHDAENLPLLKQPPKLKKLFQKKTLPSGAPATDEQVRKTILEGRATMPPFEHTLDQKQINDLLKYLHTL